jgi:hypothetical protein
VLVVAVGAPSADAQCRYRDPDVTTHNGEPTDPEEALSVLSAADVDTQFDTTIPENAEEADSWFAALLDLLRQLGLLGDPEESGS